MNMRTIDELPELATRAELAQFLDMSVRGLARWAAEGVGPKPLTLTGRVVRYRKRDVLRWLEAARRAS